MPEISHIDPGTLRDGLLAALAVPRVADEVVTAAPFESIDLLLDAASTAAGSLTPDEITDALADHPRIGDKPTGESTSAEFSRAEQSSLDPENEELAAALAEGNRLYEERFDRVFLIRAAGRTRAEILGELHRRLLLDDAEELAVVGEQLRQIALLRVAAMFGESSS